MRMDSEWETVEAPPPERVALIENGEEIGHAFLYFIRNNLHDKPYGFVEDVWVELKYRNRGYGAKLTCLLLDKARERGCYKIILTSRHSKPEVHSFYEDKGFRNHGLEFRMDLNDT